MHLIWLDKTGNKGSAKKWHSNKTPRLTHAINANPSRRTVNAFDERRTVNTRAPCNLSMKLLFILGVICPISVHTLMEETLYNNGNKIVKRKIIMWRMKGRLLAKKMSHSGAICKAASACVNWIWLRTYENYASLTNYLWYFMTNMQCNLLISFVSGLHCVTENEFDLWWAHFAIGGILCYRRKLHVFVEKKKLFHANHRLLDYTHTHTRSNKYFSNKTDSYANRVRDINKCNEIQFRCEFQLFCSVAWMKTYAANSISRCQLCSPRTRFGTFGLSTQSKSGASCHVPYIAERQSNAHKKYTVTQ